MVIPMPLGDTRFGWGKAAILVLGLIIGTGLALFGAGLVADGVRDYHESVIAYQACVARNISYVPCDHILIYGNSFDQQLESIGFLLELVGGVTALALLVYLAISLRKSRQMKPISSESDTPNKLPS